MSYPRRQKLKLDRAIEAVKEARKRGYDDVACLMALRGIESLVQTITQTDHHNAEAKKSIFAW